MSIAALWDLCGHAMYTGQGAAVREILRRILRKINEEEEIEPHPHQPLHRDRRHRPSR